MPRAKLSDLRIALQCDAPGCGCSVVIPGNLRFSDVGVGCPECGESMLNMKDMLLYTIAKPVLAAGLMIGVLKPHKPGEAVSKGYKAMRLSSRGSK